VNKEDIRKKAEELRHKLALSSPRHDANGTIEQALQEAYDAGKASEWYATETESGDTYEGLDHVSYGRKHSGDKP
jgi:hypothetical protein